MPIFYNTILLREKQVKKFKKNYSNIEKISSALSARLLRKEAATDRIERYSSQH